ncbi:MAG: endonuclease III [Spirochaetes bacterium]|nr:endonuclease III [Spirochaetota bacterium]
MNDIFSWMNVGSEKLEIKRLAARTSHSAPRHGCRETCKARAKRALVAEKAFTLLDKNYPKEISFLNVKSDFQLLISVILSARTTDRQVMEVVPALFEKYPNPLALSQGKLQDIMGIIKSVGFYRVKAANIKQTSAKLAEEFASRVPCTIEELITLPGVGRKTANVVVGSLFAKPAVIVDTHFGRVVRRIGLTESKNPHKIENDIALLIPEEKQYRFSMTANLHGREICHSRKPLCTACFLKSLCKKELGNR